MSDERTTGRTIGDAIVEVSENFFMVMTVLCMHPFGWIGLFIICASLAGCVSSCCGQ